MTNPEPLPERIPLAEIEAARERLRDSAVRTPLVRLPGGDVDGREVWLKLENLQPIGSFKLRGAGNALALALERDAGALARGVWTASAGNMAQGVAWHARRLGVRCDVVVPDSAPQAKLEAMKRLGAHAVPVPYGRWWRVLAEHAFDGPPVLHGHFVHPVSERAVVAGNGTVALEILEDLPGVGTVLVPYGGGGLVGGIGSALRSLRPKTRVLACEVETAAPLTASLAAGEPREIEHTPSFVDGIGGRAVLGEMWPLVSRVVDGTAVVSVAEIAEAVRRIAAGLHVVAEGAGAAPLAAALAGRLPGDAPGPVVCVVSGGNLDAAVLARLLRGASA